VVSIYGNIGFNGYIWSKIAFAGIFLISRIESPRDYLSSVCLSLPSQAYFEYMDNQEAQES
jgi:hypothetical protein